MSLCVLVKACMCNEKKKGKCGPFNACMYNEKKTRKCGLLRCVLVMPVQLHVCASSVSVKYVLKYYAGHILRYTGDAPLLLLGRLYWVE